VGARRRHAPAAGLARGGRRGRAPRHADHGDPAGGAEDVRSLRSDPHAPGASCWAHRDGACLSRRSVEEGR
jgi:hypothetical protein